MSRNLWRDCCYKLREVKRSSDVQLIWTQINGQRHQPACALDLTLHCCSICNSWLFSKCIIGFKMSDSESCLCCVKACFLLYGCRWLKDSCFSLVEWWGGCSVSVVPRERGPEILQCAAFPLQWSTLRLALTRPPSVTGLSVEQLQLVSLSLALGITPNCQGSCSTPHYLLWNILKFLLINIWQAMARWVAVVPAWFSVKYISKLNWIYKIGEGIWTCLHPWLLKVWSHNAIKEEG